METEVIMSRPHGSSAADRLAPLLEPAVVAGMRLSSRIVMAPMTRFRSPGGVPVAANGDYYARRAASGVGLIITEGVLVDHPSAGLPSTIPRLAPDTVDGWRLVVDAVHAVGGRIIIQLWHQGSQREGADPATDWTPSGIDGVGGPRRRSMTTADVDDIILAFARSATLAHVVGADGVEIHAAHGYLVDEFLWPVTNRRTDRFGGRPAGRARLATEIVTAVRGVIGPDFPMLMRFSQFKERDYGARIADTPDELSALLEPLADAGVTMWHASQRRFAEPAFERSALNLAGWAKRLTGLPAITVGSIGLTSSLLDGDAPGALPALAARMAAGEFDLAAVGRPLLAHPDWVERVRMGASIRDFRKADEDAYR